MTVLRRLMRHKRQLGIQRKPNLQWREEFGMLQKGKDFPVIKKGWPIFDTVYDPAKNDPPSSFRKYKVPDPPPIVDRDPEGWSPETFHELLGKFQFEAHGYFPHKGDKAEKETFEAAFNLHLVGWLKVRTTNMLGHVQGDTYALSYFRRWLEEKHLSPEAGTLNWVRLWDMNTGLESPLKYQHLICVKDRRKYKSRKVHILATLDNKHLSALERESAVRRQKEEEFLDANCVRNY
mmetsp:Transcript_125101/g.348110  ORF Transcript_125101/g.348110 Transcript_125101/m.348110 type:complete len:235 (-) Transcript_125101:72-776(-)|eukprot:CAMPEP_0179076454 /NCGR_PEP_ID=MMETSP0796-20121207/34109_1 /TAXON_ID=73915 /ORGANISM="Pyrodinium bahamense, Strain pbaha01" /LENGTH=234 /DNA_ID=CAMNT_0020773707 /DNA_START=77 /DNA_END=781 /DNA_ORIENTATION=-